MKVESGIALVTDARVYYELAGSGNHLCLIHGNTMDMRVWDGQFEEFARHFTVLRYDLRGCGKSEEPHERYSFVADLKALLDYLEIEKTAVMGISVGGGIAVNFTLTHPEYVTALVPLDPFVTGYGWPGTAPYLTKLVGYVKSGEAEKAREVWRNMPWFDNLKKNPDVHSRLVEIVSQNSGWFFERGNDVDWGDRPMTERFGEITAPTLAFVGEHDTSDNHTVVDMLTSDAQDARKEVVPESGHMVMMENPGFVNARVIEFLEKRVP